MRTAMINAIKNLPEVSFIDGKTLDDVQVLWAGGLAGPAGHAVVRALALPYTGEEEDAPLFAAEAVQSGRFF